MDIEEEIERLDKLTMNAYEIGYEKMMHENFLNRKIFKDKIRSDCEYLNRIEEEQGCSAFWWREFKKINDKIALFNENNQWQNIPIQLERTEDTNHYQLYKIN